MTDNADILKTLAEGSDLELKEGVADPRIKVRILAIGLRAWPTSRMPRKT